MSSSEQVLSIERPREYDFRVGVDMAMRKILQTLETHQVAVVALNDTGPNVGKSHLVQVLGQRLEKQGIYQFAFKRLGHLSAKDIPFDLMSLKLERDEKVVIVLEEMLIGNNISAKEKQKDTNRIRETLDALGIENRGVDLWIGLCRPDKPFSDQPDRGSAGDFVIVNTKASTKKLHNL